MENRIQAVVFNKHGVGHMARVDRFPRVGETVRAVEWEFGKDGGKGTNVAVALGKLGVRTALICKVGADAEGELGATWLKQAGVDTSHYIMSPSISTDVGIVISQVDGKNMIIGSPLHECYIAYDEVVRGIDAFPNAGYFLTGFEIDQRLSLEACRYAKACGKVTMLNASPLTGPVPAPLSYVDYLFVNEVEAAELAGGASGDCAGVAQRVFQTYRPKAVVMTLGEEGCLLSNEGGCQSFAPYRAACVDTIGAGDGFMAAFAACLVRGMAEAEAADWANMYSALVVSRKGAILSYPQLEDVLNIAGSLSKCPTGRGVRSDVL